MTTQVWAGILFVLLPVAYNVAFTALAKTFEYPDILRKPTTEILRGSRPAGTGCSCCGGGSP